MHDTKVTQLSLSKQPQANIYIFKLTHTKKPCLILTIQASHCAALRRTNDRLRIAY